MLCEDPQLRIAVSHGVALATPARDHTVKIDATGLKPGRAYYYRFETAGHRSAIGRTRTLPVGSMEHLRLAVASCSNYPYGLFNAYAAIARRPDLHAVLHLGDYLYEYENGRYGDGAALDRVPGPDRELVSLSDYRQRHAQYKSDPDLQAMHRQHPMIAVWDDHEITNDTWWGGAQNHQPGEGDWASRRLSAVLAYHEWMPIRELPTDPLGQIYRRFRFGDLADLIMLDTRLVGRDRQLDWHAEDYPAQVSDPGRSLLGRAQEAWLARQLERSRDDAVAWRVLGQQVLMSQMMPRSLGDWINADMWDGYAPARRRLLEHVDEAKIRDLIVLTGDIHSSWGLELGLDPFGGGYDPTTGRGALAVELVTPAVSSPPPVPPPEAEARERAMLESHPHLKWLEVRHRGYLLLDIDHQRTQAEWHLLRTVDERDAQTEFARGLWTERGKALLTKASRPSPTLADSPEPPPSDR